MKKQNSKPAGASSQQHSNLSESRFLELIGEKVDREEILEDFNVFLNEHNIPAYSTPRIALEIKKICGATNSAILAYKNEAPILRYGELEKYVIKNVKIKTKDKRNITSYAEFGIGPLWKHSKVVECFKFGSISLSSTIKEPTQNVYPVAILYDTPANEEIFKCIKLFRITTEGKEFLTKWNDPNINKTELSSEVQNQFQLYLAQEFPLLSIGLRVDLMSFIFLFNRNSGLFSVNRNSMKELFLDHLQEQCEETWLQSLQLLFTPPPAQINNETGGLINSMSDAVRRRLFWKELNGYLTPSVRKFLKVPPSESGDGLTFFMNYFRQIFGATSENQLLEMLKQLTESICVDSPIVDRAKPKESENEDEDEDVFITDPSWDLPTLLESVLDPVLNDVESPQQFDVKEVRLKRKYSEYLNMVSVAIVLMFLQHSDKVFTTDAIKVTTKEEETKEMPSTEESIVEEIRAAGESKEEVAAERNEEGGDSATIQQMIRSFLLSQNALEGIPTFLVHLITKLMFELITFLTEQDVIVFSPVNPMAMIQSEQGSKEYVKLSVNFEKMNSFLISNYFQEGIAKAETKKESKKAKKAKDKASGMDKILISSLENLLALHTIVIWMYRTVFREWYATSLPVNIVSSPSTLSQYQMFEQPKRILKCIHEILLSSSSTSLMKSHASSSLNANKISLSAAIQNYFFPDDSSIDSFSIFNFLEMLFALEKKFIEINSVPCFEYYGHGSFLSFLIQHFFKRSGKHSLLNAEDNAEDVNSEKDDEVVQKAEKPHVIAEFLQTIDQILQVKIKSALQVHSGGAHYSIHSNPHQSQHHAQSVAMPLMKRERSFDEQQLMSDFTSIAKQIVESMLESIGVSAEELTSFDPPQLQDQLEFMTRLEYSLMKELMNHSEFTFLFQEDPQHPSQEATILSFLSQCVSEHEEMNKFWNTHPYINFLFASNVRNNPPAEEERGGNQLSAKRVIHRELIDSDPQLSISDGGHTLKIAIPEAVSSRWISRDNIWQRFIQDCLMIPFGRSIRSTTLWVDPLLTTVFAETGQSASFINFLFENDQFYLNKLKEIFSDRIIHFLIDQDDFFFLPNLTVIESMVDVSFQENHPTENAAIVLGLVKVNKKISEYEKRSLHELTSQERNEFELNQKVALEWQEKLLKYLLILKQRLEMDACFIEIFHLSLALPYETESSSLFAYFFQLLHQRKGSFGLGEGSNLHKLLVDLCMIRNPGETWKFRQLLIKVALENAWDIKSDIFRTFQDDLFSNDREGSVAAKPKFWSLNKYDYSRSNVDAEIPVQNEDNAQINEEELLDEAVVFVPKSSTGPGPTSVIQQGESISFDNRTIEITSEAMQFAQNNRPKAFIYRLLQVRFDYDSQFKPPTSQSSTRAILNRAIESLADNLYASEFHFVMELIQNADDNDYEDGAIPSIEFYFQHSEGSRTILSVQNNEKGFLDSHVGGICTISGSTKVNKVGFIGQKGVGFKSVFSICDEPEVHSNGFHFKFNREQCMIEPIWIDNTREWPANTNNDTIAKQTIIVLPISKKWKGKLTELVNHLKDAFSGRLIMFLNKLQRMKYVNTQLGTIIQHERFRLAKNWMEVKIQDGNSEERRVIEEDTFWFMETKDLKNPVVRRNDVSISQTQIIIAIPFFVAETRVVEPVVSEEISRKEKKKPGKKASADDIDEYPDDEDEQEEMSNQVEAPPKTKKVLKIQLDDKLLPIYAYLPCSGNRFFPFIIQANFVLSTSRESIKENNDWNLYLLGHIPDLLTSMIVSLMEKAAHLSLASSSDIVGAKDTTSSHYFDQLPAEDYEMDITYQDVLDLLPSSNSVKTVKSLQSLVESCYFKLSESAFLPDTEEILRLPKDLYSTSSYEMNIFELLPEDLWKVYLQPKVGKYFLLDSESFSLRHDLEGPLKVQPFDEIAIVDCFNKVEGMLQAKELSFGDGIRLIRGLFDCLFHVVGRKTANNRHSHHRQNANRGLVAKSTGSAILSPQISEKLKKLAIWPLSTEEWTMLASADLQVFIKGTMGAVSASLSTRQDLCVKELDNELLTLHPALLRKDSHRSNEHRSLGHVDPFVEFLLNNFKSNSSAKTGGLESLSQDKIMKHVMNVFKSFSSQQVQSTNQEEIWKNRVKHAACVSFWYLFQSKQQRQTSGNNTSNATLSAMSDQYRSHSFSSSSSSSLFAVPIPMVTLVEDPSNNGFAMEYQGIHVLTPKEVLFAPNANYDRDNYHGMQLGFEIADSAINQLLHCYETSKVSSKSLLLSYSWRLIDPLIAAFLFLDEKKLTDFKAKQGNWKLNEVKKLFSSINSIQHQADEMEGWKQFQRGLGITNMINPIPISTNLQLDQSDDHLNLLNKALPTFGRYLSNLLSDVHAISSTADQKQVQEKIAEGEEVAELEEQDDTALDLSLELRDLTIKDHSPSPYPDYIPLFLIHNNPAALVATSKEKHLWLWHLMQIVTTDLQDFKPITRNDKNANVLKQSLSDSTNYLRDLLAEIPWFPINMSELYFVDAFQSEESNDRKHLEFGLLTLPINVIAPAEKESKVFNLLGPHFPYLPVEYLMIRPSAKEAFYRFWSFQRISADVAPPTRLLMDFFAWMSIQSHQVIYSNPGLIIYFHGLLYNQLLSCREESKRMLYPDEDSSYVFHKLKAILGQANRRFFWFPSIPPSDDNDVYGPGKVHSFHSVFCSDLHEGSMSESSTAEEYGAMKDLAKYFNVFKRKWYKNFLELYCVKSVCVNCQFVEGSLGNRGSCQVSNNASNLCSCQNDTFFRYLQLAPQIGNGLNALQQTELIDKAIIEYEEMAEDHMRRDCVKEEINNLMDEFTNNIWQSLLILGNLPSSASIVTSLIPPYGKSQLQEVRKFFERRSPDSLVRWIRYLEKSFKESESLPFLLVSSMFPRERSVHNDVSAISLKRFLESNFQLLSVGGKDSFPPETLMGEELIQSVLSKQAVVPPPALVQIKKSDFLGYLAPQSHTATLQLLELLGVPSYDQLVDSELQSVGGSDIKKTGLFVELFNQLLWITQLSLSKSSFSQMIIGRLSQSSAIKSLLELHIESSSEVLIEYSLRQNHPLMAGVYPSDKPIRDSLLYYFNPSSLAVQSFFSSQEISPIHLHIREDLPLSVLLQLFSEIILRLLSFSFLEQELLEGVQPARVNPSQSQQYGRQQHGHGNRRTNPSSDRSNSSTYIDILSHLRSKLKEYSTYLGRKTQGSAITNLSTNLFTKVFTEYTTTIHGLVETEEELFAWINQSSEMKNESSSSCWTLKQSTVKESEPATDITAAAEEKKDEVNVKVEKVEELSVSPTPVIVVSEDQRRANREHLRGLFDRAETHGKDRQERRAAERKAAEERGEAILQPERRFDQEREAIPEHLRSDEPLPASDRTMQEERVDGELGPGGERHKGKRQGEERQGDDEQGEERKPDERQEEQRLGNEKQEDDKLRERKELPPHLQRDLPFRSNRPDARSLLSPEQELSLPQVTDSILRLLQASAEQQKEALKGTLSDDDEERQSVIQELYLNFHGNLEHGRRGEFIAFLYLSTLYPASQGHKVRWLNRNIENLQPYDIIVNTPSEEIHVEVKTRITQDEEETIKQWIISPNEIKQALLDAQAKPPKLYCCVLIVLGSDERSVHAIHPLGFKEGGLLRSVEQHSSSFLIQINYD